MCNSCCTSLPPKTILSVFLPYSFVLPYKRKTKGRRRGKESDNERCSIEPTQVLGTWGTFIGIFAKGGEWWRRMRFGSRRSFVILQPKQNYPKSVIRVFGRLVNHAAVNLFRNTVNNVRKLSTSPVRRVTTSTTSSGKSEVATEWEQPCF